MASEKGIGKGLVFIFFVLIVAIGFLGWKVFSQDAPVIQMDSQVRGVGKSATIGFTVHDKEYPVKSVQVELQQNGRSFSVPVTSEMHNAPSAPWWKFWGRHPANEGKFTARVGHDAIPDLTEGRATLQIVATNGSWGRFFRGGRSEFKRDLPVRFHPPEIEVITPQVYINQAGCDMVLFKVSPGTSESGIQVGQYFFRSWPVKESAPDVRLCIFAYPYGVDSQTPARIVARDDVGNETVSSFSYKLFPKTFHLDTINLSGDFMERVVPPILSHTPEIQDQGSLLKNFLLINGHLRMLDAQLLVAYSQKTSSHFLWTQPFVQLTNSKVEASFADARTYVYDGQVVDHQTHLGYDLASTAHAPVLAANDGVVVFAQYFGIYGNAVLIDHGCGLQTLYGHLSSFAIKAGDPVKRDQVIGHSGETGLAGGDHLHFCVLLDGIPVNPVEWWDPHWIHDRIEAKLEPYR